MNKHKLLTREQWREQVFKRDNYACLFCDCKDISAHHILDRKLFKDGGYYINNGASVCDKHHWDCEKTDISVEYVRQKANIVDIALPPSFDSITSYDKWGNIVVSDTQRIAGIMFYEENVQKILKDKFWLFLIEN